MADGIRATVSKDCVGAQSPLQAAIGNLIHKPVFESTMSFVIMANMIMIIVETDYGASHDDSLAWAEVVGWVILIIFIIELILRLFATRMFFFKDNWNTFDFGIVVLDASFSFLGLILGDVFPVSALRIFRLCKLARVSKVFRVFPELRIMMAGLIGSFRAIFWGTVLLAFVLLVWAIVAVQFIHPLNTELAEKGTLEGCERCPRAYSSVMQAALTFSQQIVTGDSWGQATIPIIEAYPISALYFLAVFLSVGFAVMNLILGVVVNVAQTEHDNLKKEIEDEEGFEQMKDRDLLLTICADMDKDGSGELTKDELMRGFKERSDLREALVDLELNEVDIEIAFSSMDPDKSGTVTYIEFVKKLYSMKETDAMFLLEQIKYYIMLVKDSIVVTLTENQAELVAFEQADAANLEKIIETEEALLGSSNASALNDRAVVVDVMQVKEQKASQQGVRDAKTQGQTKDETKDGLLRIAGSPGGAPSEDAADVEPIDASGEGPKGDDVLGALTNMSKLFQGELRESLRRIEVINEQQASNTSKLLSQLIPQRPADDIVAAAPNLAGRFSREVTAPGVCCSRV